MNQDKPTAPNPKPPVPARGTPPPIRAVPLALGPTPPLFRRIDWLTLLVTFAVVWIGYYLTLAPELTLEDSGELATGSLYAGIPHPPGYPVWTLYTWLWTMLLPIKNIAWRVALAEATGGALAAGLLGLLVSRGSSLLMEGIEELTAMVGRWENAICMVSGFVAGALIGFNGFMWSQSVIVEVYSFSVASLMVVLLCLLRWIYAPHQRRYLYLALFFHGICFTNHQTLIVAALGIEIAIAAANFRLGRYLWLGNAIVYFCAWILSAENILTTLEANHAVFIIFHVVGVCSILLYFWFAFLTRESLAELSLDGSMLVCFLALAGLPKLGFAGFVLTVAGLIGWIKFARDTWKLGREWLTIIICGLCWMAGAAFYFYMPLAGMSNPPMEWGYPRTVEGFWHAFTRGQYEKTNPTDIIHDPARFLTQLSMLGRGIIDEFNWVYAFVALVPLVFFFKLHKRERAWIIGITAIYLFLAVLLLILLNPPPDRAAQELVRVFFTASHTLIALMVGYGLTLIAAFMATNYQRFRSWGLMGGAVAVALAIYSFTTSTTETFFGQTASVNLPTLLRFVGTTFTNKDQYGLPVYAGLLLIGMAAAFLAGLMVYRHRAPLAISLAIFALMPLHSVLTHWSDNEERNHWFGYYFGHDMFTPPFKGADGKPLYPEMTRDAILFGGTDPGRFCPTYMIFCDSFLPRRCQPAADPNFDRRDVYIITQNALADGTYLSYIRAQYNRSAQRDPPFFTDLFRTLLHDASDQTNLLARAAKPLDWCFEGLGAAIEKHRRTYTSWLTDESLLDPTGLAARLRPASGQDPVSKYLYDNLSTETRALVSSRADPNALRRGLARDLNAIMERDLQLHRGHVTNTAGLLQGGEFYSELRFKNVALSEYLREFLKQDPQSDARVRLDRLLLEAAYPQFIAKSLGAIYPDREIYTPTPEDSVVCYNEYMADAQRRMQLNQLKPGEIVQYDTNSGKVAISGQVAVMSINALLTKVIFDHNPKNEFFVEESFPLDWMFPYLTPYGIIMKIDRQPVTALTQEMVDRDHAFWTQYSERLIGNWITYDTPIKEITDWVQQVYLRRDFTGFKGDRKFVRDDQAQKSFSKLRSSLGGLYTWRVGATKPGTPEHLRALKEADFAFRQSFAFCPYSPEAVFRYVNLLISTEAQRYDDALLLAKTCQRLDPYNGGFIDLVRKLETWKKERAALAPEPLEQQLAKNPDDFQAAFNLASVYLQIGQTGRAVETLDRILKNPHASANALRALLQAYASLTNNERIQETIQRLADQFRTNNADLEAEIGVAEGYRILKSNALASQALETVLNSPQADLNVILGVAQQYNALGNYAKLEQTLEKVVKLAPGSPEAWYDLAGIKAVLNKPAEAVPDLRRALDLSAARLKTDPQARDLLSQARQDPRFSGLRNNPELKALLGGK